MQQTYDAYPKDILEAIHKIEKYQQQRIQVDEPKFVHDASAFICVHLRLICNPPQRTQRTQSEAVTLWYEKATTWRNGTRTTRIGRIFTDTKSVRIGAIRAIRVLSQLLWADFANFAPFAVKFLDYTCHRAPVTEA